MTSQHELRDRIKDAMVNAARPHDEPDADLMAQAVIDDLGLEIETQSLRWMDPNGPFPQTRVVGRWESVE